MNNFYRHLVDLLTNNQAGWIVTVTKVHGSSPGSLGQKMLIEKNNDEISGTIGGGNLEYHVINKIKKEEPKRFITLSFPLSKQAELGMVCGGDIELIVEPINVKERIIIFGAGHCCQALASILSNLNFNITVYDNRVKWLDPSLFPANTSFVEADFKSINSNVKVRESDFLVIMTYGHEYDNTVAEQLLDKKWTYLGVMGSKSKAIELKEYLSEKYDENLIARISCPIGIPIKSHSPYEIAVSISAEIINVRNSK